MQQIVQTLDGAFYRVTEIGCADLTHVWNGVRVKRFNAGRPHPQNSTIGRQGQHSIRNHDWLLARAVFAANGRTIAHEKAA